MITAGIREQGTRRLGAQAWRQADVYSPGEPVENANIERFNGRLREACLNQYASVSLDDARRRIEASRMDYNSMRPQSALGQLAPDPFRQLHQPNTDEPRTYEWCTRRG
ncbi:integrase core domain-containing protein [Burkholderia catarinensis]|uniref:integrase core domain-containing protein n=1 Tax=Burkholderia catarinensis TaxID=1108140 RepID=UPI001008110C|nr:hypothetical protein BFF94_033020 [Burkholderia catarinensis]